MRDNDQKFLSEMYDNAKHDMDKSKAIGEVTWQIGHMIELLENGDLVFDKNSLEGRAIGKDKYILKLKEALERFNFVV